MPLISIIMNCRNGEKYLREAIDSVYAQTFSDWEIIFWDNLSTDQSPEIARSYDSRLKYFRGQEFLPVGAARNEAVKMAGSEYIAFLDVDDIWMPEHLSSHLSAFGKDTIVVYSNFIIKDMPSNREYIPFDPQREFHSGNITRQLCKKNFIWLQAMTVRADAVKKLDYAFDSVLLATEDFDFALRLSLAGKFNYISEPTLFYRMHEANLSTLKAHYFAHDFSYLLRKYKNRLEKPLMKDLARQYLMTVRVDLGNAGFKVFPFLRLGLSLRQILISLAFSFFPGDSIWAIKDAVRKPLGFLRGIFYKKER